MYPGDAHDSSHATRPVFLNPAPFTLRLPLWLLKMFEFESLDSEQDHLRWTK